MNNTHKHVFNINDSLPIYSIFIFILLIGVGYIMNIFPCGVITIIENNIFVRHFIGLLTMIFFVVLVVPLPDKSLNNILLKSFILYIVFLFIAKTDSQFFVPIIVLMGIVYLLELKKIEYLQKISNSSSNNIQNDLQNKINILIRINNYIVFIIAFLTIFGIIIYLGRKKYEYGKEFDYLTFILGKNVCGKTTSELNIYTSLSNVFN